MKQLVDELIKQNRALRRQLSKLEAGAPATARGRGQAPVERQLKAMKRSLERAVGEGGGTTRRAAAARSRRPRKPVSPEVAERRRQALARARQVRAEKRAAAARG